MLAHSQGTDSNMGPTELLPKNWITEQWNAGFFITALAGGRRMPDSCSPSLCLLLLAVQLQLQLQSEKEASTRP